MTRTRSLPRRTRNQLMITLMLARVLVIPANADELLRNLTWTKTPFLEFRIGSNLTRRNENEVSMSTTSIMDMRIGVVVLERCIFEAVTMKMTMKMPTAEALSKCSHMETSMLAGRILASMLWIDR
jgi:hypothetical protein